MTEHKVHKYLRVKTNKNETVIYRCVLPGCTHYITEEFIIGRECLCWRCKEEVTFVIQGRMKYRTRPYCDLHKKDKVEEVVPSNVVDDLLKRVLS